MSAATTDSVDQFIEDREQLPTACPSWCVGQHVQALEEGCGLEDSSRHVSADYGMSVQTGDVTGNTTVQALADPPVLGRQHARLELEVSVWPSLRRPLEVTRTRMSMTSGDARVLARQLLHLADLIDLD